MARPLVTGSAASRCVRLHDNRLSETAAEERWCGHDSTSGCGGGDEPGTVAEGGRNTGYRRSRTGIITTATGLLFHAGLDSKLRVYDAATGAVLWIGDLPGGSIGGPATYEVNGRQFLVVNAAQTAGGRGAAGEAPGPSSARAYVAFALPQRP